MSRRPSTDLIEDVTGQRRVGRAGVDHDRHAPAGPGIAQVPDRDLDAEGAHSLDRHSISPFPTRQRHELDTPVGLIVNTRACHSISRAAGANPAATGGALSGNDSVTGKMAAR